MTGKARPRDIAWRGLPAGFLSVALAIAVVAAPASAAISDPVPMPNLRPPYKGPPVGPPVVATGDPASAATSAARPAVEVRFQPNSPFDRSQQVALANISAYLNSFRLMEGEFIQFGPNGEQSEGVFFLNRPGKIRFHFRPPARLDVIADGSTVAIKDGKSNTQDLYPLSKTPLRYLLAGSIDLTSPELVNAISEEADLISVVIVERSALVDGKLTMIFDRKTYELRQWVVTDAQGLNTSVAIFNTTTGRPQDPNLFRITVSAVQ
ncbi:MAG: outer membrane lipoprotein carrier protein LolA [Bauldia sp.]|nr:outer membrane lipoprotein carrier protein LolA [Bauldia sp.]